MGDLYMSPLDIVTNTFLLLPLYSHCIHRINLLYSNDAHHDVTEANLSFFYCTFVLPVLSTRDFLPRGR